MTGRTQNLPFSTDETDADCDPVESLLENTYPRTTRAMPTVTQLSTLTLPDTADVLI